MRRFALVLALVLATLPTAFAQADKPAAAAAAAKVPALDESDAYAIQIAQLSALRANDACASLKTTQDAQNIEKQVITRFETKYKGYTVDLSKGVLVAKAAPK